MPSRICAVPTCANPTAYRGRCRIHSAKHNVESHRTGRLKPSSGRLYDSHRWQVLRRHRLAAEPLCRICAAEGVNTIATQVDHIQPIEEGGNPWHPENTQSLCASHHSRKTIKEQQNRR